MQGNIALHYFLQKLDKTPFETRLKVGQTWDNPNEFVFTNEFVRHLAHFTVYNNFKKIVQELGLPEARFHDLRHTYAVASNLKAGMILRRYRAI